MRIRLMPLSFRDSALEKFMSTSPGDPAQPPQDEAQCSVECIQEHSNQETILSLACHLGQDMGHTACRTPRTACGQTLDAREPQ